MGIVGYTLHNVLRNVRYDFHGQALQVFRAGLYRLFLVRSRRKEPGGHHRQGVLVKVVRGPRRYRRHLGLQYQGVSNQEFRVYQCPHSLRGLRGVYSMIFWASGRSSGVKVARQPGLSALLVHRLRILLRVHGAHNGRVHFRLSFYRVLYL